MTKDILIAIFDGVDEIDVFGPYEVLSAAGYQVRLATVVADSVVTMRGVEIVTPHRLAACHGVIVPGGGWLDRAARGAWAEVNDGALTSRLEEVSVGTEWMASVCSGAMVLAHAGLLTGRTATTNRACLPELEPFVAHALDARVVDDGDRLTSGALFAGVDLGLRIIEREHGTATAQAISTCTGFEWQGRTMLAAPRASAGSGE